ncbi:MAG: DNA methyltransferase [Candidatus Poribacteria bacterium]|nr:DNA methyltransferase [Candidatus Poribacteria bacterium]
MTQNFLDNTLYEMDNLIVLRGMNSETVDLIATDPPFNTKRNRSGTAGFYVDNWKWGDTDTLPDQWKWNEVHPKWLEEIKDNHEALYHAIDAAKHCQGEDTAAFLCFLSVRLLEMHRILKPAGSIYLHCDPTASHYIKTCMDAIWGKNNFRNEIVWHYYNVASTSRKFLGRKHDTIFFYAKSKATPFNWDSMREPYSPDSNWVKASGSYGDPRYSPNEKGKLIHDVWRIPTINNMAKERTGSPDQKPLALYERIIKASSEEGDLVLDPFCGCATTIIAAQNLNRRWLGIDRRKDARYHIITRLMGISRKDREYIEKHAIDKKWLDRQMQPYEMHYQTEPPKRTDKNDQTAPELAQVYSAEPENPLTHAEMRGILLKQFGVQCWGCNFIPPDERYLQLDHIIPKSDGGTNHIDNRSLLCQPCNSKKSNTMSLNALRRQNDRDGHTQPNEQIDLKAALPWTKTYSMEIIEQMIREKLNQLEIDYSKP